GPAECVRFLTTAPQRSMPEPLHAIAKARQGAAVQGHTIMLIMPTQHRRHPLALILQSLMHALPKLPLQFIQLCLHPLAHRFEPHLKLSLRRCPANMRETQKVESFWFAFASLFASLRCLSAKLYQPSLFFI